MSTRNHATERPGVHPAFPVTHKTMLHSEWNGLSKREYVAAALLGGLLAGRKVAPKTFRNLAHLAIHHADELLQQLQDVQL